MFQFLCCNIANGKYFLGGNISFNISEEGLEYVSAKGVLEEPSTQISTL